jgi:polar amino acid transport system substrate-binding protein
VRTCAALSGSVRRCLAAMSCRDVLAQLSGRASHAGRAPLWDVGYGAQLKYTSILRKRNCMTNWAFTLRNVAFALLACHFICSSPALAEPKVFTPSFWDPNNRIAKPDITNLHSLRFLTEDDYPPFHFAQPDGTLAGFDIDLSRAICEELKITCTIQARRWDTLIDSLNDSQGDAIIASLRIDEQTRAKLDFTVPYAKNPARFVTLKSTRLRDALPETLRGKAIGVLANSAHEAFLEAFFADAIRKPYDSQKALAEALAKGEIEATFGDGVALSFWLQGPDAHECCAFLGGPFLDSRFFGEGVGIAVKKGNPLLRQALDYALASLAARGVYTDLYLKYFPLGFY